MRRPEGAGCRRNKKGVRQTIMRTRAFQLAGVMMLLLGGGCRTVQPPERPVANLFPTLMPMAGLQSFQPRPVTPEQVAALLTRTGCLELLRKAGMLDTELNVLARGIERRGYAEIDARRAHTPLLWLAVASTGPTAWKIVAGFPDYPPSQCRAGLSAREEPAGTARLNANPDQPPAPFWTSSQGEVRVDLFHIRTVDGKTDRWQMHWHMLDQAN